MLLRRLRLIPTLVMTATLAVAGSSVLAQGAAQTRATAPVEVPADAQLVRKQLMETFKKYPPAVGRVLKLDPSLMSNEAYLAPYSGLAAFFNQYPEVRRNPAFYLEPIDGGYYGGGYYRSEAAEIWDNIFTGAAVAFVVGTMLVTFTWIIRTLIDYRRWHRLSKVQAEAHAKLLDRFTANDELIAYVQSPAGTRFLQSAPIALDPGARSLSAPFGRILWSVQAGLVLAAGGLGLYYVSGRVVEEVAQPLFTLGVLTLSLGFGFVLSAVVSFLLSKRLGLFDPPAAGLGAERRDAPGA